MSWSIYLTHWGSLIIIKKFNVWTLYSQPKVTQITISRNSNNCPVHAAESQTGKLWISYVSNVHLPRHKSNHSSVSFSRSFCLCEICPYLSAPNDTSPRIYASFTIWEIYWEKILYHKKTGNFWGGNFLDQTIESELMCLPLKIIWNDMWLVHHLGQTGGMPYPTWFQYVMLWGVCWSTVSQGHTEKRKQICTLNFPEI